MVETITPVVHGGRRSRYLKAVGLHVAGAGLSAAAWHALIVLSAALPALALDALLESVLAFLLAGAWVMFGVTTSTPSPRNVDMLANMRRSAYRRRRRAPAAEATAGARSGACDRYPAGAAAGCCAPTRRS